ncbi:2-oxoglutarate (2OG) and Fe(II)-dependent oxygenase superfamily protein [Rhynchospora pubera]|uniref:2-oxoglutarate (2OG) and Fe(II)-dependent oxygenase superfamily protein n=1 Tax=Rhynchospora pubera TaxID=906938 RepID=A0AAV8HER0_9POAL|nr:2-oxoglutarate (2OG) and Fe(II)-dependent oxygenase superfamily protein [Rhynchospora pubera]
MGSDFKTIPIIDISPLVTKIDDPKLAASNDVMEVVRQLDEACKGAGFFYVKGHGVPDSMIKEVREITRSFFALPTEEKLKIKMTSKTGYRPETPSNFKALMEDYLSLVKDLSRKIMRGIALALGAPVDAFEGLLTLVNQDDEIKALEVQNRSGEWVYAVPLPGTFVCNIGDMLKVWSNGIYEPTLHRVTNKTPFYRVSVAYFYESNFDACIEPVECCKQKTGGVAKYDNIVYGEHLVKKVQNNFVKGRY